MQTHPSFWYSARFPRQARRLPAPGGLLGWSLGKPEGEWGRRGIVGHREDLVSLQIHPVHLREVKRAGPAPSEDGELVAGLVDRAVAVEPFRERDGRGARAISCDQTRRRARREAVDARRRLRRG